MRRALAIVIAATAGGTVAASAPPTPSPIPPTIPAFDGTDFDGDGFADLVVGIANEDVGDVRNAGAVQVLYGSAAGLTGGRDRIFTQDTPGVPDVAEAFDVFGLRVATGDFDGDGFDDLAIGAPNEDRLRQGSGSVTVLYGTARGLTAERAASFDQDTLGVDGTEGASFGFGLAVGDFDGDGRDDLGVGAVDDTVAGRVAGSAVVVYGSAAGLRELGRDVFSQATPGIASDPQDFDSFGNTLAAGDVNRDGVDDLAISAPGEMVSGHGSAGAVHVLFGSPGGVTADGAQFWHQDVPGVVDAAAFEDIFGTRIELADLNGDGFDDLAVGVPFEDLAGALNVGAVNVLYGSGAGLVVAGNQVLSQATRGIAGTPQEPDQFGLGLASGDLDGDGDDDLVVGVPDDSDVGEFQAGAFHVLRGSDRGVTGEGDQFWTQDTPGVLDRAERFDFFGFALRAGDFDGDGHLDLATSAGEEDFAGLDEVGAVHVLYGRANGLSAAGNARFTQDTPGIAGAAEFGDGFGLALA